VGPIPAVKPHPSAVATSAVAATVSDFRPLSSAVAAPVQIVARPNVAMQVVDDSDALTRAVFHGVSRGFRKVSLGPIIPYHSMPFGGPTPGRPNGHPGVAHPQGVFCSHWTPLDIP
jgi:hypothetical protein